MPVLGITGGIATGKSTFLRAFTPHFPAELFDADAAAHHLLAHDLAIHAALRATFGPAVFTPEGLPSRPLLRERVFAESALRTELERLLHPPIRALWQARAETLRPTPAWLLVDIPLLYETAAETHCTAVVVVACSPSTQHRRLLEERALPPALAEKIVRAQHPLRSKVKVADHVIWNDSTVSCLDGQARFLAGYLRNAYG